MLNEITAEELQELREFKSKVEKFISKNKNIVLKVPVCQFIERMEKELEYRGDLCKDKTDKNP